MGFIGRLLGKEGNSEFILKISLINDMGEVISLNQYPVTDGCVIEYDCKLETNVEHISETICIMMSHIMFSNLDRVTKVEFEIVRKYHV